MLETEDLTDVILIGHSYGGMVATGVADRARGRVRHLVYLDAFAPTDGQAVFDLVPPDIAAKMRAGADASASGFGIPANPMPSDTAPEDQAWAAPRRLPQPVKAFCHEAEAVRRAFGAAHLHLRQEDRHRRHVRPVPRAREARGLEDLRDRREPQPAHHQSAGAARDPERDRGAMTTARQIGIAGLGLLGCGAWRIGCSARAIRRRATTSTPRRSRRSRRRAASRRRSTRSRTATWCCSRCSTPTRSRTW